MAYYIATIHKEEESVFGVSFHDFPGCVSFGETLDEAAKNAHEALQLHIEGMLEDGERIPQPSTLEEASAAAEDAQAFIVVAARFPEQSRSIRVNITMNEHLLSQIDDEAHRLGMKRSAFLAEAARKLLSTAHPVRR